MRVRKIRPSLASSRFPGVARFLRQSGTIAPGRRRPIPVRHAAAIAADPPETSSTPRRIPGTRSEPWRAMKASSCWRPVKVANRRFCSSRPARKRTQSGSRASGAPRWLECSDSLIAGRGDRRSLLDRERDRDGEPPAVLEGPEPVEISRLIAPICDRRPLDGRLTGPSRLLETLIYWVLCFWTRGTPEAPPASCGARAGGSERLRGRLRRSGNRSWEPRRRASSTSPRPWKMRGICCCARLNSRESQSSRSMRPMACIDDNGRWRVRCARTPEHAFERSSCVRITPFPTIESDLRRKSSNGWRRSVDGNPFQDRSR